MKLAPTYQPSISLGSIVTSGSVMIAAIGLIFQVSGFWTSVSTTLARFDARTTNLEHSVMDMKQTLRKVEEVQFKILDRQVVDATQNQKIEGTEKAIRDLLEQQNRMWTRLNTLEATRAKEGGNAPR